MRSTPPLDRARDAGVTASPLLATVHPPAHIDPAEAIRSLPGVRSVSLHDDGSRVPLAVVLVAPGARRDRATLRAEVVRSAADAGLAVRPAVYDENEWEAVGRLVPPDGQGVVAPALTLHRTATPAALRRSMIRIVRDLEMAVGAISEPLPIPHHVKLEVCSRLVRDATEVLFAVHDLPFTADAAAVATFDREFVRAGGFTAGHATLHLRLAGLARQAELAYWATARDDDRRFPADAEFEEAADFLRLLERHVERTLTSDTERIQGERRRRFVLAGIGPLVGVLLLAYLTATQPERPVESLGAITTPGAIGAEYFAGEHFERKILERADDQIAVAPDGPPLDPRLGAEQWSARWSGYMLFDRPGRWHLCGKADEGQRIYLNHRLLVDDWTHDDARTACATVKVQRGWYPLRVEYHQGAGPATLSVLRGPPRGGLDAVPSWALCCGSAASPAPAS